MTLILISNRDIKYNTLTMNNLGHSGHLFHRLASLGASLVKLIQNIHSDKCKFVDLIEIKKTCE